MENLVKNNFWQDRKVLVTGATGLIGGWLVESLLEKKADVVVLVRDWVPNSRLVKNNFLDKVNVVRGDLSSSVFLERVLCEYEVQTVFHLAAQTIVPIANKAPLSTFESNIAGTWNLLEACRNYGHVAQIVVASSDKAYGDVESLPYLETTPLNAVYPYDVSKACADMICKSYAKTFKTPVAVTRCGNFFGGGDLNWNRLIPGTIRSIIRGEAPIIRSNGQLIREYIYVKDAVHAYMTLAEAMHNKPELIGEAFNFANAKPHTSLEIVNLILKIMGSKLKPVIQGKNDGEIAAQYLDSTKANTLLGWQSQYGLEDGLKVTVDWYKKLFMEENEL